jgi:hypothetical protein
MVSPSEVVEERANTAFASPTFATIACNEWDTTQKSTTEIKEQRYDIWSVTISGQVIMP